MKFDFSRFGCYSKAVKELVQAMGHEIELPPYFVYPGTLVKGVDTGKEYKIVRMRKIVAGNPVDLPARKNCVHVLSISTGSIFKDAPVENYTYNDRPIKVND